MGPDEWGTWVLSIGGVLATFLTGGGLIGWLRYRHSVRMDVSGNERQAKKDYIGNLEASAARAEAERDEERRLRIAREAELRILYDYVYALRQDVDPPPRRWPDALKRMN